MGLFKKRLSKIDSKKAVGIAFATGRAVTALIKRFDLPEGEAYKAFGLAYAAALAEFAGVDAEEMFGEEMKDLEAKMDA